MRNTQPLLAASPYGSRVEWKGQPVYPSVDRSTEGHGWHLFLERLQGLVHSCLTKGEQALEVQPKSNATERRSGHALFGGAAPARTGTASQFMAQGVSQPTSVTCPRWKRTLDLALVVSTLPCWVGVMILVTLWIKLVSPGPTFYKQERVGHGGRRFMILKFRSMRVNAETRTHEQYFENLIKVNTPMRKLDSAGDPRLIPGGRILRALGFDELPQLLNVLRGEMSLVGPRPCTPREFEHYDVWHRERVKAPPGLTGYWQVSGKNKTTFTEMIAMDIFYAEHMSLCLDLEIVLKTTGAVAAQALERNRKAP